MPSTTIKLGPDLLEKAHAIMPKGSNVSACVRELIEREYRERRLREAALSYAAFLEQHPDERTALEVWESAPLVDDVEARGP
jgi:hypothetical protein